MSLIRVRVKVFSGIKGTGGGGGGGGGDHSEERLG